MTSWADVLTNPEALSMYEMPPSLEKSDLLNLRFNLGFTNMEVDISIGDLPTKRPQRWHADVNAVSLTLQFTDVLASSMSQSHVGSETMNVSCSFRKASEGFLFECIGEGFNLWAECGYARLTHINGYRRELGKEFA